MHLRSQISYTTTFLSKVSNFRKAVLLVFVLGFSWGLQAQTTDNYPVQTTAYCAAPFSQRLSDYFSSDKRLIVNLLLKDLTKPSVQVYLRWQLEGPGIRIGSRDGFVPASFISLQPGVPSKLSGADLAGAYFFPAALQAEGMDVVDAYNLSLPEGFYTISVQAFEASTGQVVSNTSVTFLVLTSPQPPILNLPAIGSQISATSLQKVAFQWTPRHFATAESQVVYQLKVCQVPDDSEPNEQIMLSCTEPRLELTVPNTTLTGDITQWIKPLEVGQRYGVQVRAIDLAGQLNNFSNEGYSQVHWFRYGQPCVPPIFSIKSVSSDRVQLQWQAVAQAQSYLVEYQAEGDVSWTTLKTMGTTQVVSELLSRQTYLFRMRTDCGSLVPSEASEVQRWNIAEDAPEPSPQLPKELLNPELIKVQTSGGVAQTPTSLSDLYSNYPVSNSAQLRIATFSAATTGTRNIPDCALLSGSFSDCQRPHPSVGLPTGGEELGSLKVGDVLGIYDFAVFVTKVKSGPGLAGEGLVRLPFMGNAMALVEFAGVKAKKAQPSDNGGCVYEVSGFFRAKDNVTAQELAQEHQSLVESLLKESDPTAFAGTFEQALKLYDQTVVKLGNQSLTSVQAQPLLIQYLGAILQGSGQLKQQLSELGSSNPGVVALLGDLQKLMDGLQSQLTTLQTTTQTPTVAGLEGQYEAIFARIKQLSSVPDSPIENPQSGQIANVEVSKIGFNSAHLSWQGSGSIKRYAVIYQIPTLGELTLNTTESSIELSSLQAGTNYTFRVIGYGADGQVLDSYGPALFATPAKTLPAPENLTYTVLDDHSVKISWSKNSLHQRFKLSYQDANGETRTLYPSTNSAIIQGLTPDQLYLYDIVAYGTVGSENIASTATTSDFKLGESCDVSIKKTNSLSHLVALPNRTYLLAEGCSSGKISWDNGSGEAKEEGQQLKWPDGEVASSQRLGIVTSYWVVAPDRAKTYTVICRLSSGKICSASQDVTPSLPTCSTVSITASASSVPKGGSVSLSVSGCEGQWQWARGLGTSSSVNLVLQAPLSMWGECHTNGQVCISNPVFVGLEEMSCLQEVWVESQSAQKTGTNLGVVCIGCGTVGQATLQASGCENGKLIWEIQEGQARGQVSAYTPRIYTLSSIKNDVIVKVSCTQADGTSCPVQSISVPKPRLECNNFVLNWWTDSENYPRKFKIYSPNQQPFLLTDAQGLALNSYARLQVNIPFSSQDHVYKASFPTEDPAKSACQASLLVPAVTYQIGWDVSPYYPSFKAGVDEFDATNLLNQTSYRVALSVEATTKRDGGLRNVGSCPGQVVWSNDQDNTTLEAQRLILHNNYIVPDTKADIYRPLPRVTTIYWAVCKWKGATYPVSNPKKIIIGSNGCFRIDPSAFQVPLGESVKLRALGCSGSVTWKQNGESVGQGELLVHTPQPNTPPSASQPVRVNYEAFCASLKCTQTFSVNITPCHFGVTTPKSLVKIAEPVQLSVVGCEGGNVEWNTGESGRVLQVAPLQTTTYWAQCWVNGVVLCRSRQVSLEVEQAAPLDVVCPSFSIAASSTKVTRCIGSKIKFTPTCPGGDRIVWDNTTTLNASTPYEIEVKGAQTIKATCHTPYGMSVTQQVEITQQEPTPTVAPTEVYIGLPTILRATGCYTSQCQESNEVQWRDAQGTLVYTGSSYKVTLIQDTKYVVSCKEGGFTTAEVKVKQTACDDNPGSCITWSNRSNDSQAELNACWCDNSYPIRWYVNKAIFSEKWIRETTEYEAGKNRRQILVDRPTDVIFSPELGGPVGRTDYYYVTCVKKGEDMPCKFSVGCVNSPEQFKLHLNCAGDPDKSSGSGSYNDPVTPPDPCNEFAFAEKGGSISSPRSTQKTYILYSDWCVGSKVEWYLDGAKIATLSPPNGQVIVDNGRATYEYYCYLSGGVVCRNEYKLPSSSGQLSGGRIAAEDVLTAAASDCPPEAKVEVAVAMQVYLEQLLCQSIYLYQGDRAKAQAFLEQLLASLLSNPNFAGQNLSFPSDLSAVISALTGGDCKQAAQLLTQNLGGTVSFQDFNAIKNGSYQPLQNGLIEQQLEVIDISQVDVPVLLSTPTTESARIAAGNCAAFPVRYKTTTPVYLVSTTLPDGAGCFYEPLKHLLQVRGLTGNNAGYNGDYIPVFGEKTGILKGFYKVSAYTRQPNCDRAVYKFKDPAKPKPACDEHFLPKTWWSYDPTSGLFYDDIAKATGNFYRQDLMNDPTVKQINELVEELMQEGSYDRYLRQVIVGDGKDKLTKEKLASILKSLQQFKQLEKAINGGSTSPSNFDRIMAWITACAGYVNPANSGCETDPANTLVPRCLWDTDGFPGSYALALGSGFIDGLYQTKDAVKGLWSLAQYTQCWLSPIQLALSDDCKTNREQMIGIVDGVKEFMNTDSQTQFIKDGLGNVTDGVGTALGNGLDELWTWTKDVTCASALLSDQHSLNCCAYKQGKFLVDVALTLIGVEEIKLLTSGQFAWKALLKGMATNAAGQLRAVKQLAKTSLNLVKKPLVGGAVVLQMALGAAETPLSAQLLKDATTKAVRTELVYGTRGAAATTVQNATATEAAQIAALKAGGSEAYALEKGTLTGVQDATGKTLGEAAQDMRVVVKDQNILVMQTQASTGLLVPILALLGGKPVKPNDDGNNDCSVCKTRQPAPTAALCQKLAMLAQRGNNAPAVEKLCANIIDNAALDRVLTKALGFSVTEQEVFLQDVNLSLTQSQALNRPANLAQLNPLLMDAWQIIYAGRSGANDRQRTDFETIKNVKSMRDVSLLTAAQISKIIEKNTLAGCNTCGVSSAAHVNKMDEYIKDVTYFVNTFKNTPGYSSVFSSGITSANRGHVIGAVFMLKVLNNDHSIIPTRFEDNLNGPLANCEPDARVGAKILEFKSWSPNIGDTDIGSMGDDEDYATIGGSSAFLKLANNNYAKTPNSYTQFVCYLSNISTMSDLEYIFDKDLLIAKGQTDPETYVKRMFRELLLKPTEQQQVFDAIWTNTGTNGNNGLRQSLFPVNNTEVLKGAALNEFKQMVLSLDNDFFKFINVK